MAAIRASDTKPELVIRRALHRRGFRFLLHNSKLPGKPDLVFPRFKAVLFVNGCFWHGHGCGLFRWPSTREEFWRNKIGGNADRDFRNEDHLVAAGWRTAVIWECGLKGRGQLPPAELVDIISAFLKGSDEYLSVGGRQGDRFLIQTSRDDARARRRSLLRQAPSTK